MNASPRLRFACTIRSVAIGASGMLVLIIVAGWSGCSVPGVAAFDVSCPSATFVVGDEVVLTLEVFSAAEINVCAIGTGIDPIDEANSDTCFSSASFNPGIHEFTVFPQTPGTIEFSATAGNSPDIIDECSVLVTTPSGETSITIADQSFALNDWTMQFDDPAGNWSIGVSNPAVGGNTAAYRRMEHTPNLDETLEPMWVRHLFTGSTYDPATLTTIDSITMSMDANLVSLGSVSLCWHFVIVQGDVELVLPDSGCFPVENQWQQIAPAVVTGLSMFDNTAGAEPIAFGFELLAQHVGGAAGGSDIYCVDNFLVKIETAGQ